MIIYFNQTEKANKETFVESGIFLPTRGEWYLVVLMELNKYFGQIEQACRFANRNVLVLLIKLFLVFMNQYLLTVLNKYFYQMEQVCRGVDVQYRIQTSSIWRQLLPDSGVARHVLPVKSSKRIVFFTEEFTNFEMLNESNFWGRQADMGGFLRLEVG